MSTDGRESRHPPRPSYHYASARLPDSGRRIRSSYEPVSQMSGKSYLYKSTSCSRISSTIPGEYSNSPSPLSNNSSSTPEYQRHMQFSFTSISSSSSSFSFNSRTSSSGTRNTRSLPSFRVSVS